MTDSSRTRQARRRGGPLVFAGDFVATATVEGALRSGQRAAAVLLANG